MYQLLLLILLFLSMNIFSQDIKIAFTCPAKLKVTEQIPPLPDGWEVMPNYGLGNVNYKLRFVTFYDGHPEQLASLVYTSILKNPKVMVAKPLPSEIRQCEVTYLKLHSEYIPETIKCLSN